MGQVLKSWAYAGEQDDGAMQQINYLQRDAMSREIRPILNHGDFNLVLQLIFSTALSDWILLDYNLPWVLTPPNNTTNGAICARHASQHHINHPLGSLGCISPKCVYSFMLLIFYITCAFPRTRVNEMLQ